jgi:hypothetical protein
MLLGLPTVAQAAAVTFDTALGQVTPRSFLVLLAISTIGGMAAMLMRLSNDANKALEEGKRFEVQPLRLLVLVGYHMTGAWTAGIVFYSGAARLGYSGLEIGFIVPLASFACAKALEFASGITFVKKDGST